MNLIILGPPGSGKGTQAEVLAKKFNLVKVSTGDLVREISQSKTNFGEKIKSIIDKGSLLSDEMMSKILVDKLQKISQGIILDGYPRTAIQARFLDEFLADKNQKVNTTLFLKVSYRELKKRLLTRLVCSRCSHIEMGNVLKCSLCGGKLIKRADDNPEVIKERYKKYKKETLPIVQYYKNQHILEEINGEQSPKKVTLDLFKALDKFKND